MSWISELLRSLKYVSGSVPLLHLLILKYKEILSEIKVVIDAIWMRLIFKQLGS